MLREDFEKTRETMEGFMHKQRQSRPIWSDMDPHFLSMTLLALLYGLMISLVLGVEGLELKRTWTKSLESMLRSA